MMKKILPIILPLFMLTGCLTSNRPPPNIYILNPAPIEADARETLKTSLIVEKPTIAAGLDTDKIAVLKNNGRELDYLAEARWNGDLDDVIQDFMIESFENTFEDLQVYKSSAKQRADYRITTHIKDFQAEYTSNADTPPLLKVNMTLSINTLPELETIATLRETRDIKAQANTVSAITDGLEILMQGLLKDTAKSMSLALR